MARISIAIEDAQVQNPSGEMIEAKLDDFALNSSNSEPEASKSSSESGKADLEKTKRPSDAAVFQGTLTRIFFQNEEALYGELAHEDGRKVRFKAKKQNTFNEEVGQIVAIEGKWTDHEKFGRQVDGFVTAPGTIDATASPMVDDMLSSQFGGESLSEDFSAWYGAELSPSQFSAKAARKALNVILKKKTTGTAGSSGTMYQEPAKVTQETMRGKALEMMRAGRFKRIGPKLADRLDEALGLSLPDVMNDVQNGGKILSEAVKGISPRMGNNLVRDWTSTESAKIASFLISHRMVYTDFSRIYKQYKRGIERERGKLFAGARQAGLYKKDVEEGDLIKVFRNDPYKLVGLGLVNFTAVDALAPRTAELEDARALAATLQTVRDVTQAFGHSCLPLNLVTLGVAHFLGAEPTGLLQQAFQNEEEASKFNLILRSHEDQVYVYETSTRRNEEIVAQTLLEIQHTPRCVPDASASDGERYLKIGPPQHGLSYTQEACVETLVSEKVSVLTGYAGTGKTYLLREVARRLELQGRSVVAAAPTGRAAQRLHHSTGLPAATVHRLLKITPDGRTYFKPLPWDTVIVDEASMMDLWLARELLSSIEPTSSVIFVGDPAQLQSVGQGNLLDDLIRCRAVPTCALTEVFRQRGDENEILANATAVRQGEMPPMLLSPTSESNFFKMIGDALAERHADKGTVDEPAQGKVIYLNCRAEHVESLLNDGVIEFVRAHGFDPIEDMQVITPRRKGLASVTELNPVLQQRLNGDAAMGDDFAPEMGFRPNDKVMQVKNCYTKNVFNGNIGIAMGFDNSLDSPQLIVGYNEFNDFEAAATKQEDKHGSRNIAKYSHEDASDELELAYATTVHKAQGSQYPVVVLPVFPEQGRFVLNRNLLYTALTRASHYVIVLGNASVIREAVRSTSHERFSLLSADLSEGLA
ncbi:ATP-dependent RecD-like DNA helicase [Hondaea fermentalgiana]|uniref:ATP-dependent RecD-like DNA helicase n=1 Tax=Hondaea fermentalgiana TaxID=2315210 RepID=A0A2R5G3I5_9STRA|nr:ATP-dependent RecD-like DNA helicase [Hondaea fermentalgiana]|eukprot:GBG25570.1 ATP-dependent RecD-like DNA helicase [Hondaea fermentalgiana]